MNPYEPSDVVGADEQMLHKTESLLHALDAFTRSESWAAAKHVVEQHDELLSEEADALLAVLIAKQEDQRAIAILQEHRRVLARCRAMGIEEAFADRVEAPDLVMSDIDPMLWERLQQADSYEALTRLVFEHPELMPVIKRRVAQTLGYEQMAVINAIESFLAANTWDDAYTVIVDNPLLLSLDADIWLMQYADFVERQGDDEIASIVGNRRWLLARCRLYGVDFVFRKHRDLLDGLRMELAPDLLAQMLSEAD